MCAGQDGMRDVEAEIIAALSGCLSQINARAVLRMTEARAGVRAAALRRGDGTRLLDRLIPVVKMFATQPKRIDRCVERLRAAVGYGQDATTGPAEIVIKIQCEKDVVSARSAGHAMCRKIGFSPSNAVRVATAVSELARNMVLYAGEGVVTIRVVRGRETSVEVVANDQGPGIPHLEEVLSGRYRSPSGLGMGILGTRRLMDEFEISSEPGRGTLIRCRKHLAQPLPRGGGSP